MSDTLEREEISYKNLIISGDDNYTVLLAETKKIFDEILEYGVYIMKIIIDDSKKEEKSVDTVPFSILKEIIELGDGISIMISNSCFNSVTPVVRSLFELFIYVKYMFNESEKIEEKSILYHLQGTERQIFYCNKRLKNRNIEEKEREICEKLKNNLEDIVKDSKYKKYHEFFNKEKRYIKNWYNYYEINSIKKLSEKVDMLKYYDIIYERLSYKSHGNDSLRGITSDKDTINLPFLRTPDSIENLEMSLIFISLIYQEFIKNYLREEDMLNYEKWKKEYSEKKIGLLKVWKSIELK